MYIVYCFYLSDIKMLIKWDVPDFTKMKQELKETYCVHTFHIMAPTQLWYYGYICWSEVLDA